MRVCVDLATLFLTARPPTSAPSTLRSWHSLRSRCLWLDGLRAPHLGPKWGDRGTVEVFSDPGTRRRALFDTLADATEDLAVGAGESHRKVNQWGA
jgi:hypothetical protein